MIPYWVIVPMAVGVLVYRYARSPANSYYSKKIVVGLTAGVFLLAVLWPAANIIALIGWFAIGIYLVLNRDLRSST
jgi:hypothetical protein